MTRHIYLLFLILLFGCVHEEQSGDFIQIEGTQFTLGEKPYEFVGTNFWYGAYLGQPGENGNRERLLKELDFLKAHGVTNLRILGASEESSFVNSLSQVFIQKEGSYNNELLKGLDFLLSEMTKREMKAVIFLTNYWEWSGGMSMYVNLYEGSPFIDPAGGDWDGYMKYVARFYQNELAQQAFRKYIKALVTRKNTVTNTYYYEDPTIMSWQLANEPRPGNGVMSAEAIASYIDWIHETAGFIKQLAPKQLVSSGSEGRMGSLDRMDLFIDAHATLNIDYLTFHMWAKNWGWINPQDMKGTIEQAVENAARYIDEHLQVADSLQKPIVMEEFGFPRDGESYLPESSTAYRDQYFKLVFSKVEENELLAGTNFWSWGGYGTAQNKDYWWVEGDPFTGDPPQEPQGLNSIFVSDSSTLAIIKDHAEKLNN